MDVDQHRFQMFISDIAGQDIKAHGNDTNKAISIVRNWLRSSSKRTTIPGGSAISARYVEFRQDLPGICKGLRLVEDELTFNDYTNIVSVWLQEHD
jgi:hypothetical protein